MSDVSAYSAQGRLRVRLSPDGERIMWALGIDQPHASLCGLSNGHGMDNSGSFSSARIALHFEGLMAFVCAVFGYDLLGGSWVWFAVLFLAPDLSMLGYVVGPRMGHLSYNLVHTYVGPLGLGLMASMTGNHDWYPWLLIWLAHLGIDRALGFGLKVSDEFRETHLQRA